MKEITCCFTGHREIPKKDLSKIQKEIKKLIAQLITNGYRRFCTGGALGFDTIAAESVLDIKSIYPDIKLILILPCYSQSQKWNYPDKVIYENIKQRADEIIYTSNLYYSGCMHKRNRALVEYSSACVCYITKETGGTAYTVNYAKQNGLEVFYL